MPSHKQTIAAANGCAICKKHTRLSFHHLIPKTCHSNKWFKKNFEKAEMHTRGIALCRACHTFLHRQFSEKQLGREYNTLEKLLSVKRIANYAEWAQNRNH